MTCVDLTDSNEEVKSVPAIGSRDEGATNAGASTSSGFGLHPSRGLTPAVPARGGFGQGGWRGRGRGNWRGNWGRGGGRGNWGRGRGRGMFQVRTRNRTKNRKECHEMEKDLLKVRMLKFQQRKTLEKHGDVMMQVRGRNSSKVSDLESIS